MKNYLQRERKQKAKKNRMDKSGRSLLSIIEIIVEKKAIENKEIIKAENNKPSRKGINNKRK